MAYELPLLVTDAFDPGDKVVVVPTETVGLPGTKKLSKATEELPEFVTLAGVPAANVDVELI